MLTSLAVLPTSGGWELDIDTVLLGILLVAVLWLAWSVATLRQEINELKGRRPAVEPAGAPAAPPVPPPQAVAPPPPPAKPQVNGGIASEELAAIAAAVQCVLGAGARVLAVVPPDANGQAWSREGRRQVFQSHQIR